MPRSTADDRRELGLELGLLGLSYFVGTEELHYGLWDDDLEVCLGNFPAAQRRYTERLVSRVPEGARSVLDVGCGTGTVALRLRENGHDVECVCPSATLVARAARRLGPGTPIHECTFEELDLDRRFDVVLFSESFQYVPLEEGLRRAREFLAPGGVILICDFFRTDVPGRGPLGGGHRYSHFRPAVEAAGLRIREDEDLTDRIAPSVDVVEDCRRELLSPMCETLSGYFHRRHPRKTALFKRLFRRRLDRLQHKYLSGERNAAAFRHWKTYRCILLEVA